jgi:hypothetical protein
MPITLNEFIFENCVGAEPVPVDPWVGMAPAVSLGATTRVVSEGPVGALLTVEREDADGAAGADSVMVGILAGAVPVGVPPGEVRVEDEDAPVPLPDVDPDVEEEEEEGGPEMVILWIVKPGEAFPESPSTL